MSAARPALVVNADDAGLHEATDRAILRCFREGVVRSASVVANGPTTERFVERALALGLDLGLHLNLTEGRALGGPLPRLTDAAGRFGGTAGKRAVLRELVEGSADVGAELRAQWDRLVALGVAPTHVDGHNHVHVTGAVAPFLRGLGRTVYVRSPVEPDGRGPRWFPFDCARLPGVRTTASFVGHALAPAPSLEAVRACLAGCVGPVEWMAHPGRRPGSAFTDCDARDREEELLCSEELRRLVRSLGYRIASFAELLAEEAG